MLNLAAAAVLLFSVLATGEPAGEVPQHQNRVWVLLVSGWAVFLPALRHRPRSGESSPPQASTAHKLRVVVEIRVRGGLGPR